jgi:hypothetical protein
MYPLQHFIFGTIFSLALLLVFPQIGLMGFFLILCSSVLIDIDHYLYYAHKKKNYNLKNAYTWFLKSGEKFSSYSFKERDKFYCAFCFLHGIEFLLILFIFSFFSKYFLFIFIGVSFHLILDLVYQTTYMNRIDKFSILRDYFKIKKMEFLDGEE